MRRAFYSTGERADTSCGGHAAVWGRSRSSSSDLCVPVITPYTPQSGLLLACHSQPGARARPLNRLPSASCRCWRSSGARTGAGIIQSQLLLHCKGVCQCLFRCYLTLYFTYAGCWQQQATSNGRVTLFEHTACGVEPFIYYWYRK